MIDHLFSHIYFSEINKYLLIKYIHLPISPYTITHTTFTNTIHIIYWYFNTSINNIFTIKIHYITIHLHIWINNNAITKYPRIKYITNTTLTKYHTIINANIIHKWYTNTLNIIYNTTFIDKIHHYTNQWKRYTNQWFQDPSTETLNQSIVHPTPINGNSSYNY